MNILILEDEQRAGDKLIDCIGTVSTAVNIQWIRSVSEAIDYLEEDPDLDIIFSDIELLDGNVFNVYKKILPNCPIIFCTAYDTFYLEAFKTNGIAYILKPFSLDEFNKAWNKYMSLFKNGRKGIPEELIAKLKYLIDVEKTTFKRTFSIKKRDGVFLLRTTDIMCFQAQGDFVLAYDFKEKKHIINDSLSNIEKLIDKDLFFRINRSEILNKNSILKYNKHIKNRLSVTLKNSEIIFYTSNGRTPDFRDWIES